MLSTPEIFTDNITMSPGPTTIFKNFSAIKLLLLFTEVLYVKKKTAVHRVGAYKSNSKEIRSGIMLW